MKSIAGQTCLFSSGREAGVGKGLMAVLAEATTKHLCCSEYSKRFGVQQTIRCPADRELAKCLVMVSGDEILMSSLQTSPTTVPHVKLTDFTYNSSSCQAYRLHLQQSLASSRKAKKSACGMLVHATTGPWASSGRSLSEIHMLLTTRDPARLPSQHNRQVSAPLIVFFKWCKYCSFIIY